MPVPQTRRKTTDGQVPERRKSKMDEKTSLPPGKKKKWFWRLLIGGLAAFGLVSLGLIGISLPDLTRKVSSPVISGPRQLEKTARDGETALPDGNGETPRSDDAPTSRTVLVDASGREILNLRDFPHLSPTMRYLAEEWIVAWKELAPAQDLDQESTTTLYIQEKIGKSVEAFRQYLNLPQEWEKIPYQEALDKESIMRMKASSVLADLRAVLAGKRNDSLLYDSSLLQYKTLDRDMGNRMQSELAIQHGEWRDAVHALFRFNTYRRDAERYDSLPVTQQSWEDELYCWRQMGVAGQIGLIARSYEESIPPPQNPNLTNDLMHLPAEFVWEFMTSKFSQKSWTPPQNPEEPTRTEP
jgi:hypothetical protein